MEIINFNIKKELSKILTGDIKKLETFSGGHLFETSILDILETNLKPHGYKVLSGSDFKNDYGEYVVNTQSYNFDFSSCVPSKNVQMNKLIVHQPNGSQKYPDILIIDGDNGIPIEIKTSKKGNILWNSGLPRDGTIYIYGNYEKGYVTYFLGEDVISKEEKDKMYDVQKKVATIIKAEYCNEENMNWYFYSRKMYVSKLIFRMDENSTNREETLINFLEK